MRFTLTLILTAALAYLLGMFLDWWSIALAAFAVALLLPQAPGKAFFSGFLGIALLWGMMAGIMDLRNDHILATRMSKLILQSAAPFAMVFITAVLGGIVGALSALSASVLRRKRVKQI